MSSGEDFKVVDLPGVFSRSVVLQDASGTWVPDPSWHREVAESFYVFAEFLGAKGYLSGSRSISRDPDLKIRWSELTDEGKAFVREHQDRWLASIDRDGIGEPAKAEKLERRWKRLLKSGAAANS